MHLIYVDKFGDTAMDDAFTSRSANKKSGQGRNPESTVAGSFWSLKEVSTSNRQNSTHF